MDWKLPPDRESTPFLVAGAVVEPTRNRITAGETALVIEPQVMALLVYLAMRAGEVVTRSELLDALWPDTPTNDEALTQAVSKLRRGLGDRGRQRRIIETVRKVGYRLAVPAEPIEASRFAASDRVGRTPAGNNRIDRVRPAGQRTAWMAIAAVGLLSLANAAMLVNRNIADEPRVFMMRASLAVDSLGTELQPMKQLDGGLWHASGQSRSARWHTSEGIDSARVAALLSEIASAYGADPESGIESSNLTIRVQHVGDAAFEGATLED